ncbi:hypothetical protein DFH09DRAFT_1287570 [Mycena vulgaris]|nr:hypothetical protein DFH09DRAFT_1287570 [Mycena vulgaris]
MGIEDAQRQTRARAKGGVASGIHQVRTRGAIEEEGEEQLSEQDHEAYRIDRDEGDAGSIEHVGAQGRIRQGDSSRGTETNAQEGGAADRRSESSARNRGRGACGTTAQAGINALRRVMHARRAAVGWAETDSSGYGPEGAESFSEKEIDDPACKAPGVAQQPWRSGF